MTQLHSPLHALHEEAGARFTPFGDWLMPLKYDRELDEHRAVRERVGVFDLSHMGELRVRGPQAPAFLDHALISRLSAVETGRAKYSMIVAGDGGVIDDLITYRLAEEEYLVVPNAANTPAVLAALRERAPGFDVVISDESAATALVAVQGPAAEDVVAGLIADPDEERTVRGLRYYAATRAEVAGIPGVMVARTGYTGEDGYELYTPDGNAVPLWCAALAAAEEAGGRACGLAARDSLRLEAAMPLYGHELSRDLTPFHAGLGVLVSFAKEGDFIGRAALEPLREDPPARTLAGLAGEGRRAAREGAAILDPDTGEEIGRVTSGQLSPTLGHPIALGILDRSFASPGVRVEVDIRGRNQTFTVVETPFYRRGD